MPSNRNYIKQYQKWIEDYGRGDGFKKGKFYLISEYVNVDGEKKKYSFYESPIIFTLYISDKDDIIHCLKITDINPNILKKFFDKLIDVEKEKIVVSGGARQFYTKYLMNVPGINNKIYRTYKLSGVKKYYDLDMNVTKLITKISNKDTYKTKVKEIKVQRENQ
jgi:hypothetical protein